MVRKSKYFTLSLESLRSLGSWAGPRNIGGKRDVNVFMRKIFLVFMLLFVLACQGLVVTPTPVPTGSQGNQTPTPISQATEATGEVTSTPSAIVPIPASSIQIEGVPYTAYQIPGEDRKSVV